MTIDGWTLREIRLDATGHDSFGWQWGQGDRLFHLSDGTDSISIRAPCPFLALWTVMREAWPPRLTKRFNWEYKL